MGKSINSVHLTMSEINHLNRGSMKQNIWCRPCAVKTRNFLTPAWLHRIEQRVLQTDSLSLTSSHYPPTSLLHLSAGEAGGSQDADIEFTSLKTTPAHWVVFYSGRENRKPSDTFLLLHLHHPLHTHTRTHLFPVKEQLVAVWQLIYYDGSYRLTELLLY